MHQPFERLDDGRIVSDFNALPATEPQRCHGFTAEQAVPALAAAIAERVGA